MSTKHIDDLTIDEIKEQMALFTRLYYKKKKVEDPEILERSPFFWDGCYYQSVRHRFFKHFIKGFPSSQSIIFSITHY